MSRVKVQQSQERMVEWGKETHTFFFPHPCSESKLAIFFLFGRNISNKGNKRIYADVQNGCWKGLPSKQNLAIQLRRIQMILEICYCKTPEANIIFRSVHRVFSNGVISPVKVYWQNVCSLRKLDEKILSVYSALLILKPSV